MQLAELNRVIRHARDTVPLYRQRGLPEGPLRRLESIRDLPLLTKEDLRQPVEVVTSDAFRGSRLAEIHTGGTTGKPLTIYCDSPTLQRNYAFFARFREWAGVSPGARVATFMGRVIVPPEQRRPPFWRRNAAGKALLFSSYHLAPDTIRAYVDRLVAYQPVLIDSYPSSIEPIARYVKDHGIRGLRPRAVITSSETLLEPVRRLIEDALCCRVFDHYGAAEMAALVTQCEAGSYHLNPEFGIVELLRQGEPVGPGEAGEIVATGFINPVMPLIRYGTGDAAVWGRGNCRCGRAFPTLERIEGRMDDVLVTPEGRRIGRLDPIFKSVASLYETRIVQDQPDHVRVEVVLKAPLSSAEENTLRYELGNRLGPRVRIDILRVASLPRTAAGKLRAVVNEVSSAQRAD
jgi:phenylacetate-CoA ligase